MQEICDFEKASSTSTTYSEKMEAEAYSFSNDPDNLYGWKEYCMERNRLTSEYEKEAQKFRTVKANGKLKTLIELENVSMPIPLIIISIYFVYPNYL